jgi:hypothetical protein
VLGELFDEVIILNPFSSTEKIIITRMFIFFGNDDDVEEKPNFKIENNFHIKIEADVSFINIKFIINTTRTGSSDEVFNSVSGGIMRIKNCIITATDLELVTYRLFTINASLIVDNLLVVYIVFKIPGINDPSSPFLIPDSGNAYFEKVQLINISKTSNHDFFNHRHNGSDFSNCIFENIEHPGTVISFWCVFYLRLY